MFQQTLHSEGRTVEDGSEACLVCKMTLVN
jgi:hypothetical protein